MNVRSPITAVLSKAWLVQPLIAVGFLGVAAWQVNLRGTERMLVGAHYEWLLVALLIYVSLRLLHVWEWRIVLKKVGQAPFFGLFGVLLIGSLVNAVFPANLGDVAKVQIMANRYSLPRAGLIAGRGAESVANGLMFAIFVLISVVLARRQVAPQGLLWAAAAASTCVCIGAIAASLLMPDTLPQWPILRRLPRGFHAALEQQWPRLRDGFEAIRRPKLLVSLLLLNLAGWVADIAIYGCLGKAFNLHVPFGAYVSVTVVLAVITTFPITFGNVGSWEFGVLGALALYGVASDQALAYAVGGHVFTTVSSIGLGLAAMTAMGVKPSELLALRHSTPHVDAAFSLSDEGRTAARRSGL